MQGRTALGQPIQGAWLISKATGIMITKSSAKERARATLRRDPRSSLQRSSNSVVAMGAKVQPHLPCKRITEGFESGLHHILSSLLADSLASTYFYIETAE